MERWGKTDTLGRYYTREGIGALLVEQMQTDAPSRVLDLGAGGGSLSMAVRNRWSNAELLTVDVDKAVSVRLEEIRRARHTHIQADALSSHLPKLICSDHAAIDAAVCNPPFITPRWKKGFGEILESAGFINCLPAVRDVDAALLFLAQNLRLLSPGATLGIVLPDSLISSKKYRAFRERLLERHTVFKIIRLPRGSFQKTDAQAYIAVIGNAVSTSKPVKLQDFDLRLGFRDEILVDSARAIDRLDYAFHSATTSASRYNTVKLGDICTRLSRGSLSSSERFDQPFPVIHTTDLDSTRTGQALSIESENHGSANSVVCAKRNDILLARVGRNLEKKIALLSSDWRAISDCVYALTVPSKHRKSVLDQLTSVEGQRWIASRAYGVSAMQLAKSDLLAFPVRIRKDGTTEVEA